MTWYNTQSNGQNNKHVTLHAASRVHKVCVCVFVYVCVCVCKVLIVWVWDCGRKNESWLKSQSDLTWYLDNLIDNWSRERNMLSLIAAYFPERVPGLHLALGTECCWIVCICDSRPSGEEANVQRRARQIQRFWLVEPSWLSHLSTRVGFGDKTINCKELMAGSMDNMIQILIVILFSLDSNQTGDNFKVTLWSFLLFFFYLRIGPLTARVFLQPGLQTPAGQTIDYNFLVPLQWRLLRSLHWICFNGQCVVIKKTLKYNRTTSEWTPRHLFLIPSVARAQR